MFNSCLPIIVTVSTGFQNVIKADEITFDVGIRIGNAVSDACLCCQVYNDSRFIFVKQADDDFPICYRVVNEHKSISKFFQAFQSIMFQGDIVIVGNAVYTDDLQFCIVRQKPFDKIRSDKAGNSSYQNCFAVQYYIVG